MLRFARALHTVPLLNGSASTALSTPLGPLLSPQGLAIAWTQTQQNLTNELNTLTAGTADESRFPLAITLMSQRDSRRQRVHNVASQAFNNHFFFQQFSQQQQQQQQQNSQPSRTLLERINAQYGSLGALKAEILRRADDVVGQGWVFVVEDANKQLKVVALNNSGSPFTNVQLNLDLNGPISETDFNELLLRESPEENYNVPLIAFNLWDYAYLEDYGIKGRQQFVEKTWDTLDWSVINKRVFSL
jgi:Fe-Mn family superoxide dismutase